MPQVTVYVRKEDLPKWEAIEKKSKFISDALNGKVFGLTTVSEEFAKAPSTVTLGGTGKAWSGPIFRDKKKGKL